MKLSNWKKELLDDGDRYDVPHGWVGYCGTSLAQVNASKPADLPDWESYLCESEDDLDYVGLVLLHHGDEDYHLPDGWVEGWRGSFNELLAHQQAVRARHRLYLYWLIAATLGASSVLFAIGGAA